MRVELFQILSISANIHGDDDDDDDDNLSVEYTVLPQMESCFEDLRSKTFQWEKRVLLSKMRTKGGPILKLLRTSSRYFHQNEKRS